MSEPDCKNCWFRIMMARTFDMHIDHLDCWEDCERIHELGEREDVRSRPWVPKKKGEEK